MTRKRIYEIWMAGCSCADDAEPWQCGPCTRSFLEAMLKRIEEEEIEEIRLDSVKRHEQIQKEMDERSYEGSAIEALANDDGATDRIIERADAASHGTTWTKL